MDEPKTKQFAQTFTNLERLYVHMKTSDDTMTKLSIMMMSMAKLHQTSMKTVHPLPNGFIDQIREYIVDVRDCYIRKEKSSLFIWC